MEKTKHRFNIVDFIIIVAAVLALLALLKIYFIDSSSVADESITLQYVIQTDNISEELAGNVSVGDKVYDMESGRLIGEVTACDVRNATHVGVSSGGSQQISDIAGYKSLHITVETEAEGGAKGYYADSVMLPDLFCTGCCINAEVIG